MMIKHIIFARSNFILCDPNVCLLSYNVMEEGLVKILLHQDDQPHNPSDQNACLYNVMEGLVKILLDQDDRANIFCPIICVFARSYDR